MDARVSQWGSLNVCPTNKAWPPRFVAAIPRHHHSSSLALGSGDCLFLLATSTIRQTQVMSQRMYSKFNIFSVLQFTKFSLNPHWDAH